MSNVNKLIQFLLSIVCSVYSHKSPYLNFFIFSETYFSYFLTQVEKTPDAQFFCPLIIFAQFSFSRSEEIWDGKISLCSNAAVVVVVSLLLLEKISSSKKRKENKFVLRIYTNTQPIIRIFTRWLTLTCMCVRWIFSSPHISLPFSYFHMFHLFFFLLIAYKLKMLLDAMFLCLFQVIRTFVLFYCARKH